MTDCEYVLGTGDDELARLALQNRLWSDAAVTAWRRASLTIGERVLDVGCGPGFAGLDLAQVVGPTGAVVGIDESDIFVRHANEQAKQRGTQQFEARAGDVQQLDSVLDAGRPFDFAYARWVLCFVKDPEAVVAGITAALRPGGRLVVHDYFNYASMTLAPRRRSHDLAVAATVRSWTGHGGDPDIAGRLPAMFLAHGLQLDHLRVHQRIARGSDSMFAWPDTWWRIYGPKLVAMGELEQADCDQLIADLETIKNGEGFVQCPPVYELIATKVDA